MMKRAGSMKPGVALASPGCIRRARRRRSCSSARPAAWWIAPSTPRRPDRELLAAFTTASTSRVVMSPCTASTTGTALILTCEGPSSLASPGSQRPLVVASTPVVTGAPGCGRRPPVPQTGIAAADIRRVRQTGTGAADRHRCGRPAPVRRQCGVRLFVAVWPPEDVIDLVGGVSRPEVGAVRWTTRAQWHVTLRFLGEVAEAGQVAESLRALAGSGGADAMLGPATAWFPGRRVLQVPVTGLEDLEQRVGRAIWGVGHLTPNARESDEGFRGHLTLARVRGRERVSSAVAGRLSGIPLQAEWQVDRISLVASVTRSGGSSYTDVAIIDL